jgi:NAD(P)-dependent dehydrogenase (short-subunit alcohol dehydrogenase family)
MGREAALRFAAEGAKIVGCDVHVERGLAVTQEVVAAGGEMVSLEPCDLTSADNCLELVALAVESFGQVDVLYNNGAMAYFDWVATMPNETWTRTINEELNLVFLMVRAAWPELQKRGGSIINVASIAAWQAQPGFPALAHGAAKGGVLSMTRHLAMEGAAHGIRVNSLSPGIIESYQTASFLADPAFIESTTSSVMLRRPGTALEVANAALFLASEESSYVTATDIRVDGGAMGW